MRDQAALLQLIARYQKQISGQCMHRSPGGHRCPNKAIGSHSIQKNGGLKAVTENGHVIRLGRTYAFGSKPTTDFQRLGRTKASVFPGFCAKHDTEIFQEVEAQEVPLNLRTLLLVSYRSICQEYYKKEVNIRMFSDPKLIAALGKPDRETADAFVYGSTLALSDLGRALEKYETVINGCKEIPFAGWFFEFAETLPFCCTSSLAPEYDAHRNKILPDPESEWSSVSWYSGKLGARSIFCIGGFLDEPNHDISGFLHSLESIPASDLADISLNFSIFYAENTFFRESWVNSISIKSREWMRRKFLEIIPGEASSGAADIFESQNILTNQITSKVFLSSP